MPWEPKGRFPLKFEELEKAYKVKYKFENIDRTKIPVKFKKRYRSVEPKDIAEADKEKQDNFTLPDINLG